LERTFIFGDAAPEQRAALTVATEAFYRAKRAIVAGTPMRAVDAIAAEYLREAGYADFIRHGTGHAHGIMIGAASREEWGELRSYNDRPLSAGIVCSVEPGIYLPDVGGFRHSDVMLVQQDHTECLTEFPVEIEV